MRYTIYHHTAHNKGDIISDKMIFLNSGVMTVALNHCIYNSAALAHTREAISPCVLDDGILRHHVRRFRPKAVIMAAVITIMPSVLFD